MEQFLRSLTYQFHDSYIDQKLIDADINHKYNVASRSLINFFIVNFLHYFPNFFHLDELIKKITDNLNEITLVNLEDKPSVFGFYRMTQKRIKINQKFNKLDDFIKLDIGLFHEFIHAITELSSEEIKQGDIAFIEMMTTLFEEEYHIRKYGKIDKRINTYIPIYVRELYMIYGEDLLKEFLIHKSNIRHLLNIDDYHYENLKNNFTVIATEKVKKEMDFNVIEHTHIELEKTILKILENYLLNSPLTFCEKVEKINCMRTRSNPLFFF